MKEKPIILPLVIFATSFALLLFFNQFVLCEVSSGSIVLTNLYSVIFDWSAIQTGFLFSVYGFIVSRPEGFVDAVSGTCAIKVFKRMVKIATIFGFTLTLTSMVLVVLDLRSQELDWKYVYVALVVALFFSAFYTFLWVAYKFGQLISGPKNPDIPA